MEQQVVMERVSTQTEQAKRASLANLEKAQLMRQVQLAAQKEVRKVMETPSVKNPRSNTFVENVVSELNPSLTPLNHQGEPFSNEQMRMENIVPRVNDLLLQPQSQQQTEFERPTKKRRTNKGNEVTLRNIRTDPRTDELPYINDGVDLDCGHPHIGEIFTNIAKSMLSVGLTIAFGALFKSFLCTAVDAKSISNNGSTSTAGQKVPKPTTDNTLFRDQSIFNEPF
jgi:hypothetical protein